MFGIGVAAQIFAHLFGKIHHHLIMQGADLVLGMQVVQFLNVKITETEGLFQFHSMLAAQPGDHSRGDDKMIFQIHHRVPGKLAHTLILSKAALFTVSAHIIHIAPGYRAVKLEFFPGVPMFYLVRLVVRLQKQPFFLVAHACNSSLFWSCRMPCPRKAPGAYCCFYYTTNRTFPQRAQRRQNVKTPHFGQKAVMDLIFFVRF